jgi:hypothetical protein
MWCNGRSSAIMWRLCRIEKVGTLKADGRPTEAADGPGHRLAGLSLRIGFKRLTPSSQLPATWRPIFLASEQAADGVWFGPTRTARHDGSGDNGSRVYAALWVSEVAVVKRLIACTRYAERPDS